METMKTVPNRMYKATVFAMLFEDKKRLLELYNAISGKHYTKLTLWKMPFIWL